jgi:hypothetical protein
MIVKEIDAERDRSRKKKCSRFSKSSRLTKERIEKEIRIINDLKESKNIEHDIGSEGLAIELHYELGYSYAAILRSGVVSKNTMTKANLKIRKRGKGRNILDCDELLEVDDWIEEKISRHEQPRAYEIDAKVCFCLFLFRF